MNYTSSGSESGKAIITPLEWPHYAPLHNPTLHQGYTIGDIANEFMEKVRQANQAGTEPDILAQKVDLAEDKTGLTLSEISQRENLRNENLNRLYDDLLRIENCKIQVQAREWYLTGKTQIDLLKLEIQARDLIRRELKEAARDIGFVNKELRQNLIEAKQEHQKKALLDDGLEFEITSGSPAIEDQGPESYQSWGGQYR